MLAPLAPALLLAATVLPGEVHREVLDNGLTVLVLEEPGATLVTVGVAYEVGARNEAAGTTGLAHYAEHMTFRGTRRFPGSELSDSITRRGGRWSAYTWIDQTYYATTLERSGLEHILDLEADRMTHALFAPEDFRKERTSVLAELRSYDDPKSLLYDAVLAASFEIHPYRNNSIGWLSDVEGVTREEAYAFYRRFYAPNHAVLVVAGDVGRDAAVAKVRERFAALPASKEATDVRTIEPAAVGQKRLTLKRPGPHAQVILAFRAPALADPDFPTLVLFDALLAGGRGFAGSILRGAGHGAPYPTIPGTPLERATMGTAREARSDWQVSTYPYVYTLSASTPEAKGLPAAEGALFSALGEAAGKQWSEDDRRRALRQVRTGLALDLDDQRGRVHQLALFEVAGGYEHLGTLPERVVQVTNEDLRRFARQRLGPDRATVGWFEPADAALATATAPLDAGFSTAARGLARPAAAPSSTAPGVPTRHAAAHGARAPVRATLQTASGLRVEVEEREGASLAALCGRIDAGSAHDGATPGLAALATEILARPLPGEGVDGPSFSWRPRDDPGAAANLEAIEFAAAVLPEDLPHALQVLAGRVQRPPPDGLGFDDVRAEVVRRATTVNATAQGRLLARALTEIFPVGTALRHPPWADEQGLLRLTPAGLRAFWRATVAPGRMTMAIAGDVRVEAVRAAITRAFAEGAPPKPAARPSLPAPRGARSWREARLTIRGALQDDVLVVWPAAWSRPGDEAATQALLYLLGETGYAGRLGGALVEPGLVYSVEASLEGANPWSFLAVRTACGPRDTPEVRRRIRAVLEEAALGRFTEAEKSEAESYLKGKAARQREGSVQAAAALLRDTVEPATRSGLTLAALNDTARRLFARGFPVVLVAGDGSEAGAKP